MIGNDIIDLRVAAAENNWRRKGFLEKIFSKEECDFLSDFMEPDVMVWLLWAMKESAYKAHQREFGLPRKFNPKDFNCKINYKNISSIPGEVTIGDYIYYTNSSVEKKYIYCYASLDKNLRITQKIFNDSTDITQKLVSAFSDLHKLPQKKIFIKKNIGQVPYIFYENREINCNLSLTHHGIYSAFIFELINI